MFHWDLTWLLVLSKYWKPMTCSIQMRKNRKNGTVWWMFLFVRISSQPVEIEIGLSFASILASKLNLIIDSEIEIVSFVIWPEWAEETPGWGSWEETQGNGSEVIKTQISSNFVYKLKLPWTEAWKIPKVPEEEWKVKLLLPPLLRENLKGIWSGKLAEKWREKVHLLPFLLRSGHPNNRNIYKLLAITNLTYYFHLFVIIIYIVHSISA